MKLSAWAKKEGVSYRTAFRWFRDGKMPVNTYRSKTGSIFVEDAPSNNSNQKVVIYCRVSSHPKKEDLNRQVERCKAFCEARGLAVEKVYKEIASGMNDNRTQLLKMLDSNPTMIVVENKDRLTRFGFNYLDTLLRKLNCKIEVINRDESCEQDLMKDLISVITSFCCRLYGMRRGYAKAKKIKDDIANDSLQAA
jgi:putative resolvase